MINNGQRNADPVTCNSAGLDMFAAGDPVAAETLLRQAYKLMADEPGILVNLGLALMQQGRVEPAERCYRIALNSPDIKCRRSAAKNLGFLLLWKGKFDEGWHWHGQRFAEEAFLQNQWRGDPLKGQTLTIWNDVGMGDAFQFVRYTLPLIKRGERVRWAVDASQINIFRQRLAWPLNEVVNRSQVDRNQGEHIPLMSLIPLLDIDTSWGRNFRQNTWTNQDKSERSQIGICWASNPNDQTMHAYKSSTPERLMLQHQSINPKLPLLSLQTDEHEAHQKIGLIGPSRNWLDTLDRISQCQKVISVDTAVTHLAGGAGCQVELWLGNPPDWRWRQFPGLTAMWHKHLTVHPLKPD